MNIFGIVGAGGFGREVIPLVKKKLESNCQGNFKLVFVDDGDCAKSINGYDVLTSAEFSLLPADKKFFNITIGDSQIREKIAQRMWEIDAKTFSITADNALILDENEIGEGAILCPFTTITSNVKIGKFFHANIYSYIAHDCIIGDYVTFAPSVKCNGNVTIEDHAYIGTGAIIKQGRAGKPLKIGKGAIVGMGAVVTKDVAPGAIVVGNPAKPLPRKGLGG
ncbi:acetyltransferase [Pseudomonas fildesensis]|uniref:acetyltransferase n=1 Tax=Pseudomonas fildesensis TaxID=1674920 RepID=UPI000A54623D|nr:acetyltransferase [Pseudomonas fildesensis]